MRLYLDISDLSVIAAYTGALLYGSKSRTLVTSAPRMLEILPQIYEIAISQVEIAISQPEIASDHTS